MSQLKTQSNQTANLAMSRECICVALGTACNACLTMSISSDVQHVRTCNVAACEPRS